MMTGRLLNTRTDSIITRPIAQVQQVWTKSGEAVLTAVAISRVHEVCFARVTVHEYDACLS